MNYNLKRFISAQNETYLRALTEINRGQKYSHWIWFIYPTPRAFGQSPQSLEYGLRDMNEAKLYLNHPILGERLREMSSALLKHPEKPIQDIVGFIDACKIKSCMTLFDHIAPNDVFAQVLNTFYNGLRDKQTLDLIRTDNLALRIQSGTLPPHANPFTHEDGNVRTN